VQQIQPDISDDARLIVRTVNGDTAALGILIDRHRKFVAGIASRFLLRDEEICEVVQDAFIRVWKHAGEYDSRNRFTTWLYTITFNLCLDRIKSLKRRREVMVPEQADADTRSVAGYAEAAAGFDREVIHAAVREFAAELGEVQRHVFILRDLQDLSVEEVIEMTGYDAVKVKTNLYHARKIMRERLTEGGYL
jgi:RNA polymerase sigma-70 factor (ECF subfamily)